MRNLILAAAALLFAASAHAAPQSQTWVPTWYAPPEPVADAPILLSNTTVRQIVHTTAGGKILRLRLSNAFGATELHIDKAAVALRGDGSAIAPGTDTAVTFAGQAGATIPPGAFVLSDPVAFDVPEQGDLAVSYFVSGPAPVFTVHLQQRNAVYYAAGDVTDAETLTPVPSPSNNDWTPWLSQVEVAQSPETATVVAFGDSITDGAGPKADSNASWPDDLYGRFRDAGIPLSLTNAAISGNRLLHNGQWAPFGSDGLARFDADVLAQPNVRAVIVLIGINDIGHPGAGSPMSETTPPEEMEAGLSQLAMRAHEHGLKIYIGTLTPFRDTVFKGYYSDDKETQRQAVNAWIRHNGVFDGYADFDKALDDPANPGHLRPDFDSGDHLHPSAAGDTAIADAIPLGWFATDTPKPTARKRKHRRH